MQTFLPYANFAISAQVLDYKRLGKQRVEAMQLYRKLRGDDTSKVWSNHPALLMWKGYENALAIYYNYIRQEWIDRGYKNTMPELDVFYDATMPPWLSDDKFHASHRSNLLRKLPEHYSKFGWTEPNDMEYVWPVRK
jgi:hypothetical protein